MTTPSTITTRKPTSTAKTPFTSALDYVISDTLPTAYLLTGHGEGTLPQSLTDSISRQNILLTELNLATESAMPDDAACLFICSPTTDLSSDEVDKITSYLDAGGKLLLVTDYSKTAMPNLAALGTYYGLHTVDGIVIEGDQDHSVYNYPHYVFPTIASHQITDPILKNNYSVLMPIVQGIAPDATYRSSLTMTPLLTTSAASYSKVAATDMTTTDKEPGDIDGPFNVAMLVTESVGDNETRLIWFGGSSFLADQVDNSVSGANTALFLNALGYLCEKESSITIHSKDFSVDYLTVPASGPIVWGLILAIILPLATVICGTLIWRKRRKRV
jgi:ABC-2 type transport system permease protein